jgi:hypothetical protein
MTDYFSNFIQHRGQIDSFLATALLWFGFSVIGSFFLSSKKIHELSPFYGWAAVNFIYTILGVFTQISFSIIAAGIGSICIIAIFFVFMRKQPLIPAGTFKITVLFLPLLLLVSAMTGSQWDEFSDWLISPRLLLDTDAFPTTINAHQAGSLAAYPYGWHFISYLASLLAGRFLENAGALTNVFMLMTFSLVMVRFIRAGSGDKQYAPIRGWSLCAIAGLSATLLNTTFAQKVALTSYADLATAMITGLSTIVGWYMLDALAKGKRKEAYSNAMQTGLLLMLLVNLKQSTIVMAVLVLCAIALAGLRDPKISVRNFFPMLPLMVIPAAIIFIVWRYYVSNELSAREMNMSSLANWHIELIPQILQRMLLVLSKKGAYFLLLIVIIYFCIKALITYRTPFDRYAIIAGSLFLGHNAFLFFAYVSTFSEFDALRAASYWRYNMQLGMIGVAFTVYGLAILWHRYWIYKSWRKQIAWLPILLLIAGPFIFAKKLRFDRQQPIPYFRNVGAEIKDILVAKNSLFVIDPSGSGESGMITRYELEKKIGIWKGYLSAFHSWDKKQLRAFLTSKKFTHLLVHSINPVVLEVIPVNMDKNHSYVLESDKKGSWKVIKSWQKPR